MTDLAVTASAGECEWFSGSSIPSCPCIHTVEFPAEVILPCSCTELAGYKQALRPRSFPTISVQCSAAQYHGNSKTLYQPGNFCIGAVLRCWRSRGRVYLHSMGLTHSCVSNPQCLSELAGKSSHRALAVLAMGVCDSHCTCSAPPLVPCPGSWLLRISWRRWARAGRTRARPCQATGCSGTESPSSHSAAPWGSPSDPRDQRCAETRDRGGKRSIKIWSVLLACSAEKVLDSDRRNFCLLMGGDRVGGKTPVGTAITRTPKQQCTWEKEIQAKP